jgi:hypothetical protein
MECSRQAAEEKTISSFLKDRMGLAWQLTVAGLSVIFMPFVYWPLSVAWEEIYTSITGMYTFTGAMAYAVTFAQILLSYLIAFFLVFCVYWVLVNAKNDPYGGY